MVSPHTIWSGRNGLAGADEELLGGEPELRARLEWPENKKGMEQVHAILKSIEVFTSWPMTRKR